VFDARYDRPGEGASNTATGAGQDQGRQGTPVAVQHALVCTTPDGAVHFEVSAGTHPGAVRDVNEDAYVASPPLFLVADGMGGHAYGAQASLLAARTLADRLLGAGLPTVPAVLAAIHEADELIAGLGGDTVAGCTLAGVALVTDVDGTARWMAFNLGDSRIYRWDGERLAQLSVDHSVVQELIDDGVLGDTGARRHPERHVITRALGSGRPDPDVWLLPLDSAAFLICSDGLTRELAAPAIADVLRERSSSPADRLVAEALAAGGADNVTVVVVEAQLERATSDDVLPAHLEATLPRT